jgi:hypothetical protein
MRYLTILTITAVAVSGLTATTVRAAANFIKATGSVDPKTGDYVATFKEAGLGNTPITYELKANPQCFTFQCFTKSGNKPQGEPNSESPSLLSTFVTITPRNGQITGSVSLTPEQGGASCQGNGLNLFLIAVYYGIADNPCDTTGTNTVTLTDTTNGVTVLLPSASNTNLQVGPF